MGGAALGAAVDREVGQLSGEGKWITSKSLFYDVLGAKSIPNGIPHIIPHT